MKTYFVLCFLTLHWIAQAQCTQCGGSRVDVSFSTATLCDTNGIDSTLIADFSFILDFKNSKFKYFKDGVLQYTRTMQNYGIMKDNKHFCFSWNSEKNPGADPAQVIVDLKTKSFEYKPNLRLGRSNLAFTPTLKAVNPSFTIYKHKKN